MESKFNSENFERFLKDNADQYRIYPSERVWKGVYNALHTRRRWFGIGFILLLLSAGFVTTMMLTNTPVDGTQQTSSSKIIKQTTEPAEATALSQKLFIPEIVSSIDEKKLPGTIGITNQTIQNTSLTLPADIIPATAPVETPNTITSSETRSTPEIATTDATSVLHTTLPGIVDEATDQDSWNLSSTTEKSLAPKLNTTGFAANAGYPYTIESVINSYISAARKAKKLSYQFYFSPTISYRKLSENKSYLSRVPVTSAPYNYAALYYNINNVVTHKPDMGLELGFRGRYKLTDNIKLLAGLQFNMTRYDIKAFTYPREVATIALNTGTYRLDSVSMMTSYRNFNGYQANWLHNFYYQVAIPVGIELNLTGDEKVHLGIAGTIQPTYILGERAYLLSSDYKHYVEIPWLIRRWNVNTSLETFVAYSTGKLNWQVGPQVRYQLKSSFVNEYPVKENLFDFGLKIGISPNK
jgi:hypothetical protein